MKHFPIFITVEGRRIIISGGQEAALAKLRLLLKTSASITVYAEDIHKDIMKLATEGKITIVNRALAKGDAICATLFYGPMKIRLKMKEVLKLHVKKVH